MQAVRRALALTLLLRHNDAAHAMQEEVGLPVVFRRGFVQVPHHACARESRAATLACTCTCERMCVCVRARVRACVYACVHACVETRLVLRALWALTRS